jgi:hypothetical protein
MAMRQHLEKSRCGRHIPAPPTTNSTPKAVRQAALFAFGELTTLSTDAKLLHEAFTVTPLLITLLIVAGIALLIVIGYLNNVVENGKLERAGSRSNWPTACAAAAKSPRPSPASS